MSRIKDREAFIKFMVESGVLLFGDFVTKSGRNTPYFINTGNYRTGRQMTRLGEFYADQIMAIEGQAEETGNCVLFGPAYKGIPIVTAAAVALDQHHGKDLPYCFNRKEVKDHGEGGILVGHPLAKGDTVLILEDVLTAGTAVRETLPLLLNTAGVKIGGLVISVDRMEKGKGNSTAVQELREEFGIVTYPIVTVKDIVSFLEKKENRENIGVTADILQRMENYFADYCVD